MDKRIEGAEVVQVAEGQKQVQLVIDPDFYDRLFKVYWLMKELGEFKDDNPIHVLLGACLTSGETEMTVHMSDKPFTREQIEATKLALEKSAKGQPDA